ncbi:hypothetical protein Gotur_035327 [Gossypium turneri]
MTKLLQKMLAKSLEKMVISVYVSNLPSCFHWKGPWKISEFHGKVLDAFIPKKRHRKGLRFGLVRFGSIVDDKRAVSKLNGFCIYGSKVNVNLDRFKGKVVYWKKVENGKLGGDDRRDELGGENEKKHSWGNTNR